MIRLFRFHSCGSSINYRNVVYKEGKFVGTIRRQRGTRMYFFETIDKSFSSDEFETLNETKAWVEENL